MMINPRSPGMLLSELLAGFCTGQEIPSIPISDISSNSRSVKPGSVFIALPGIRSNGIDYDIDAVKAGAVAVIYDADDEYSRQRITLLRKQVDTCWIGIDQLDRANGYIVSRFFGNP